MQRDEPTAAAGQPATDDLVTQSSAWLSKPLQLCGAAAAAGQPARAPAPTSHQLAQRHVACWQLIERALAAEQFTDDARAAVQRLDVEVQRFAAGPVYSTLPAVPIKGDPQFIAVVGMLAVHLGNGDYAAFTMACEVCVMDFLTPTLIGLHLATAHFGGPASAQFETSTPGVYMQTAQGLTLSAYRNSHGRGSAYVAWTWATADGRWAITAGGVTGYPRASVSALVAPSVRLPITSGPGGWAARVAYLPKPHSDGAHGVHISLEKTL